jgi:hypothetical protein
MQFVNYIMKINMIDHSKIHPQMYWRKDMQAKPEANEINPALTPDTTETSRDGKISYGIAAWLLGLPLPIIIIALFVRGCDW